MADGLTMEDVQTEAAAKQRAFESQEAKPSTSGRGIDTGQQILLPFPPVAYSHVQHCRVFLEA